MFSWPCISIHQCNENQLDALFILSLFRQSASTCFEHICSPSSGGVLYIYNNWDVLYIYSIPPDDGLQICSKHVEIDWRNKQRINKFYDRMTVHRNRFLVNKTNRCTEFNFIWYYYSTCFGQPFCPSSGVLSRTSALVHSSILLLAANGHKCIKCTKADVQGRKAARNM